MNGWLILEIALGVALGQAIWAGLKSFTKKRQHTRGVFVDSELEHDWYFLWNNVPDSAKNEVRQATEDEELFQLARRLNLWPNLWHAAPEEVKEQMRGRWKQLKIPPRWKS